MTKQENTTPATITPDQIKWDEVEKYKLSEKGQIQLRQRMLNFDPPAVWLKSHPVYKNTYLPIDKVEFLLTNYFGKWYVEVREHRQILNSITVIVRLFYRNPDTGEYDWQDGAGAAPMQTDAGSKAFDAMAIKTNAVMLALPIAETNAIKDAADKIGKVFGRDLNRKDTLGYEEMTKNFDGATLIEK